MADEFQPDIDSRTLYCGASKAQPSSGVLFCNMANEIGGTL